MRSVQVPIVAIAAASGAALMAYTLVARPAAARRHRAEEAEQLAAAETPVVPKSAWLRALRSERRRNGPADDAGRLARLHRMAAAAVATEATLAALWRLYRAWSPYRQAHAA